jgi:uncharacterized protein (DUF983 family)
VQERQPGDQAGQPGLTSPAAARPGAGTLLGRAARLRCPACGRAGLMHTWFTLQPRCRACGLSFERDEREDYWLGAFLLNFIVTETLFAGIVLVVLVATWPEPAWSLLIWVGVVQMIVTPIVFYPFSKALWLATDLVFRPPTAADFASHDDEADQASGSGQYSGGA